jgi:hypothetical protein
VGEKPAGIGVPMKTSGGLRAQTQFWPGSAQVPAPPVPGVAYRAEPDPAGGRSHTINGTTEGQKHREGNQFGMFSSMPLCLFVSVSLCLCG